mgnify:CR=1 FL=1
MSDAVIESPDYGSPSFAAWRAACAPTWQQYTGHPFVQGLANGALPPASFLHYLIQDYLFLMHFARAWSLVVVKAGTISEMRLAAATVDALVNQEMKLHVRTCAEHGISEAMLEQADEASANIAYTRYVLATGHAGDLLDLLAALTPCVFGYGEIGHRLGAKPVPGNRYQPWIDTYADAEYQQVCRDVGTLLEAVVARRLGSQPATNPRWAELSAIFAQATALEVNFWAMGLEANHAQ